MENCINIGDKNGKFSCRVAHYKSCGGAGCPFYATHESASKSLEKANTRLNTLTMTKQRGISDKYYDGKMPWKNNSENF